MFYNETLNHLIAQKISGKKLKSRNMFSKVSNYFEAVAQKEDKTTTHFYTEQEKQLIIKEAKKQWMEQAEIAFAKAKKDWTKQGKKAFQLARQDWMEEAESAFELAREDFISTGEKILKKARKDWEKENRG